MHEAETTFSKPRERVEAGEEITILRDGEPVAVLVPSPGDAPVSSMSMRGVLVPMRAARD